MRGLAKKARDGSASAAKTLGRIHRDGEFVARDPVRALDWFRRAAELGDPGGMHDLALFLLATEKPDRRAGDVDQALSWLRIAAKAKHGGAMTALGRLHLNERHGLEGEKAVGYFQDGVAVGHPGAMAELARLHAAGRYVEKNRKKAIDLAQKGADRGHAGSRTLLRSLTDEATSSTDASSGAASTGKPTQNKEG